MNHPTTYLRSYDSPLGPMTLAALAGDGLPDGGALTGAWFDGQAHDRAGVPAAAVVIAEGRQPTGEGTSGPSDAASSRGPRVLVEACSSLDAVFSGHDPGEPPTLAAQGTPYQQCVWEQLRAIPRGSTRSYRQIAQAVEARTGRRGSARAVGGAVGRNPLSVFVPCHRVVGSDGALTGYAGGVRRKIWLLRSEGVDQAHLRPPAEDPPDR